MGQKMEGPWVGSAVGNQKGRCRTTGAGNVENRKRHWEGGKTYHFYKKKNFRVKPQRSYRFATQSRKWGNGGDDGGGDSGV